MGQVGDHFCFSLNPSLDSNGCYKEIKDVSLCEIFSINHRIASISLIEHQKWKWKLFRTLHVYVFFILFVWFESTTVWHTYLRSYNGSCAWVDDRQLKSPTVYTATIQYYCAFSCVVATRLPNTLYNIILVFWIT